MTRTAALVLSISLLLLGGAWLLSRSLTADVPVPQTTLAVARPAQALLDPVTAPPPRPALAVRPEVVTPPPPQAAPVPQPPPPAAPELSPEQVELEGIAAEAFAQLKDEHGGPANWRRAEKLFVRCLVLSPEDERCKEGLNQARLRIGPKLGRSPGVPLVPVQDPPPPDPDE